MSKQKKIVGIAIVSLMVVFGLLITSFSPVNGKSKSSKTPMMESGLAMFGAASGKGSYLERYERFRKTSSFNLDAPLSKRPFPVFDKENQYFLGRIILRTDKPLKGNYPVLWAISKASPVIFCLRWDGKYQRSNIEHLKNALANLAKDNEKDTWYITYGEGVTQKTNPELPFE